MKYQVLLFSSNFSTLETTFNFLNVQNIDAPFFCQAYSVKNKSVNEIRVRIGNGLRILLLFSRTRSKDILIGLQ